MVTTDIFGLSQHCGVMSKLQSIQHICACPSIQKEPRDQEVLSAHTNDNFNCNDYNFLTYGMFQFLAFFHHFVQIKEDSFVSICDWFSMVNTGFKSSTSTL